jgi:hypothetical protein
MRIEDNTNNDTEKVNSKEKYLNRTGVRFGIKVTIYV